MEARNAFPADENTDLTPRIVAAQRRANMVWLVGAVAAFLAAGGISLLAGNEKNNTGAIEVEAQRIAAAIDNSAKGAHVQADGIAATPMLRAAIITDAATLADIAKSEVQFTTNPGETLEIFQVRAGKATTLLRLPATATAIEPILGRGTRLENSGKGSLDVVASSPITPQAASPDDKTSGEVALSVPVDLAATRQRLAELVVDANLAGVGQPLALVPNKSGAAGKPVAFPVQANPDWKLPAITLNATLPNMRPKWIDPARYASLGLGGLMVIMFLIGLRRR